MRQSLQSKFNILGVLFVVFFLLMLPMSYQVNADAKDAAKERKNTLGWKFARDVMKSLKPSDLEDVEVEDYWADYGRKAEEQNPACRQEKKCGPDDDMDGDGVSNKDEVKNGTNPACNEKEKGEDYCKNVSPYEPDPGGTNGTKESYVDLGFKIWEVGARVQNCPNAGQPGAPVFQGQCQELVWPVDRNFTRLLFYANATWQGSQWNVQSSGPAVVQWSPSFNHPFQVMTGPASRSYVGTVEPVENGNYVLRLTMTGMQHGLWNITAYGHVAAVS